ncbi:HlyD family efflux transporter periplasmic adaptor subunit [Nostoc sp. TCL26-01]|uniref:HlyD family efflux transporter periplasmic adaptor subunit n=1 Tax=Nostoc sp. TCL26-01 TaxID=2576904 RepID=UPI0015BF7D64|nr:HlyD family efflux transporter periplasmic adaptor subunit [Nostoc sp. TCL26-01]QLE57356.1 HlyD family efflux transporter periplasmic adaptor subunit [Nostoc sp. TCL26-01]
MTNILNGKLNKPSYNNEQIEEAVISPIIVESKDDWSFATKELLDSLPQVWTRGLLYFLVVSISIILPWAILFKVDETGTARGRIEPKGKTVRLDAPVSGIVQKIMTKEGESVKAGQNLLVLDTDLLQAELRQIQDKLEGQLNRRSQLNSSQNQLLVAFTTQQQQNRSQELEKQSQIDQARQNLIAVNNTYELQKEEKKAQVNQAKQNLEYSKTANILISSSSATSQREEKRYHQLWQAGVIPETNFVEKQEIAKEKQKLAEQSQSDIQQAYLRLAEQQSSYERVVKQGKADITQAQLRLNEQERSYQTLIRTGKLALLKIAEQQKTLEAEITTLAAEIAQTKRQIESLNIQIAQRQIKAPVSGTIFQLPIQKAGAAVQPGTMVAEIAAVGSPLVIRGQMETNQSGSLREGLPVKLKFDAYPFQDYGVIEGELIDISPTTIELDTTNGKAAAYNLEITLKQHCIKSGNKCIPLRPGDTATAEVIVRQRRIIDFLLDPFKQLQSGGLKL